MPWKSCFPHAEIEVRGINTRQNHTQLVQGIVEWVWIPWRNRVIEQTYIWQSKLICCNWRDMLMHYFLVNLRRTMVDWMWYFSSNDARFLYTDHWLNGWLFHLMLSRFRINTIWNNFTNIQIHTLLLLRTALRYF